MVITRRGFHHPASGAALVVQEVQGHFVVLLLGRVHVAYVVFALGRQRMDGAAERRAEGVARDWSRG